LIEAFNDESRNFIFVNGKKIGIGLLILRGGTKIKSFG
jgi:hypothetical protein